MEMTKTVNSTAEWLNLEENEQYAFCQKMVNSYCKFFTKKGAVEMVDVIKEDMEYYVNSVAEGILSTNCENFLTIWSAGLRQVAKGYRAEHPHANICLYNPDFDERTFDAPDGRIWEIMEALKATNSEALKLSIYGYSNIEIANILKISTKTVTRELQRARRKFAELYK